ncbi:ribosome production factor 2-like protein Non3 [Leptinotarsa decemlineata]|uniref:ribosome production factor 2-like protein Non3 n=1 Tax=Leptinotarsa decemlineata TaxID=7539 RepID=UPI000C254B1D|nr:ribosome production factor 2 homolog [Leptinotarsa decemlineata]
MSVLQRVVKPTTRKGKKVLLKKEPQVIEGPKRALFFHGRKSSETCRNLLKDFYDLKKPDAVSLNRKNDITIFENAKEVENFCKKHDTSLFLMGSHSKKRPDNLVIGRMFDYSLLDMIELNVESYEGLNSFRGPKFTLGTKPCLLFNGPLWEESQDLKQLKSIFIDFFHREYVEHIRLQGLEHTICFTATPDGKIIFRSYKMILKKSGLRTPRVELEEIGPRADFSLRRTKLPDEDLMKEACRKPKELQVTKKKNISTDELGTTHGRIHIGKQDIHSIQTRKMKGLKEPSSKRRIKKIMVKKALAVNNDINQNKNQ